MASQACACTHINPSVLCSGSIFYKIDVNNFVVKFSLSIFAASAVSFASFAEIPVIFVSKRTAARHMEAAFYKPLAYTLSVVINVSTPSPS